tara:strand:+ start:17322 stop:19748 length:2427 start_codon:yes stop_codon:yes gene_type:complete
MIFSEVDAEFDVIVIGSGPGGLAAASRARELQNKHILLEAEGHPANTIYQYQKGKHVMAEPAVLPLRCGMTFDAGKREKILSKWDEELEQQDINIQYNSKVKSISKDEKNAFNVELEQGKTLTSKTVVLAIGLQGNVRKLGVPGEEHPKIEYTVSDPEAFNNEVIVVIGPGDAGIENALALSKQNTVYMINRADEFSTCKDGNRKLILDAEKNGAIGVEYSAFAKEIIHNKEGDFPITFVFDGKDGLKEIPCNRIIVRIGAIPPRKLVESFGVKFPNESRIALPTLTDSYESSVSGLFIVGALGGYPLIKQAMNQGYEVIQSINELPVVPVDEDILRERLCNWNSEKTISEILETMMKRIALFSKLSRLQMREIMLESNLQVLTEGDIVFEKHGYGNTFFSILNGTAKVKIKNESGKTSWITLKTGSFFGEMGLISGRRRTATIEAGAGCVLIETSRRAILKLMSAVEDVSSMIDAAFVKNALINYIGPYFFEKQLSEIAEHGVEIKRYSANQVLCAEGDEPDGLYLIRRGSVSISKNINGVSRVLSYVAAGNYVGEMALVDDAKRSATIKATVMTEVLLLSPVIFKKVLRENGKIQEIIKKISLSRKRKNIETENISQNQAGLVGFLLAQGLGESSNALVINENLCVQCNNCEIACAETHGGVSRLKREAGATFAYLHLPISCRHCEHPHCMKDCPPDAISRGQGGEVFISDACIGCGNCEKNCPYDVIRMAYDEPPKKGGGLLWLLFGIGSPPGDREPVEKKDSLKKAVKCDLCKDQAGGPACVRACPTGAAIRLSPEELFKKVAL